MKNQSRLYPSKHPVRGCIPTAGQFLFYKQKAGISFVPHPFYNIK